MITQTLKSITESRAFERGILALIGLAAVIVGLETSPAMVERFGDLLFTADQVVIYLFALEAAMKMGARGRHFHRYFQDPWNVFDFTIVVLCFVPATGHFAAVLRLARVLRALRLVSVMPRLQLLVSTLLKGLPSMGYVAALLLLLLYVYGVMGVFLFQENDPFHFGSLGASLLTLFQILTLDNWDDIFFPQMMGTDAHPAPGEPAMGPVPMAQPVAATLYFVSFILIGTLIVLNLVIGVIINAMDEEKTERERADLAEAREADEGLTAEEEVRLLEHDLERLQKHLHLVRARLTHDKEKGAGDGGDRSAA